MVDGPITSTKLFTLYSAESALSGGSDYHNRFCEELRFLFV